MQDDIRCVLRNKGYVNPNVIDLVFRQTRVKARADEGTMIEIELV